MSDSDEKKSEIIVLERVPSHHALMKSNRWLVRCVLLLMTVIFVGGFYLLPGDDYAELRQGSAEKTNPRLLAEMDSLKGQLVGLVSGSIESKLRSLEDTIRVGSLTSSLGTIEDIKNDIRILKDYNRVAMNDPAVKPENERLIQEMSHLKRLIYFIIAACGLMLAAVAGIWVRHQQLPFKETIIRYLKNL